MYDYSGRLMRLGLGMERSGVGSDGVYCLDRDDINSP